MILFVGLSRSYSPNLEFKPLEVNKFLDLASSKVAYFRGDRTTPRAAGRGMAAALAICAHSPRAGGQLAKRQTGSKP
jgi:hypothetical protein